MSLIMRRYRVFYGYGVDNQLGFEVLNLFQRRETQGVESKPQPLGILLVHSRLVLEAEQVEEKAAHLACS